MIHLRWLGRTSRDLMWRSKHCTSMYLKSSRYLLRWIKASLTELRLSKNVSLMSLITYLTIWRKRWTWRKWRSETKSVNWLRPWQKTKPNWSTLSNRNQKESMSRKNHLRKPTYPNLPKHVTNQVRLSTFKNLTLSLSSCLLQPNRGRLAASWEISQRTQKGSLKLLKAINNWSKSQLLQSNRLKSRVRISSLSTSHNPSRTSIMITTIFSSAQTWSSRTSTTRWTRHPHMVSIQTLKLKRQNLC